ncbi:MAG: N4-gp56 family major capsid protein [Liquorilactobacillus nagelii]|jgi:N4-gp56 family major capsid protein|uniref:N4-gp56 family major capsid protein n=1 Tax=Liquorilactobacillus nagelii TaxID=82688 RepID=UPI00242C8C3C|nr:N4-gp56 family major capsid protein [Liquorilactobacillus nagelii]MCI1632952.1 N4-gp56 family major capsid protein [Liquorilactobacillus nagelii]
MADTTLTQLEQMIDPEVMATMLQAQLPQAIRFTSIAPIDTTLEGRPGDTVTVPRYKYIGDAQDVAEGAAIQYNQLLTATQKVTIKKAGIGVKLTDEAVLSGYGDPVGEGTRQLGLSIGSKLDNDILATAKTAPLVVQHAIDLDLPDAISGQMIDSTSDFNTETDDTATGVLFLNPKDANALRKLAASDWTRATELGDSILVTGVFGELFGWQIVRTRKLAVGYGIAALPGAMKTYLKRGIQLETARDIDYKLTKVNADEHYGVAIMNDAKIVQIKPASSSSNG